MTVADRKTASPSRPTATPWTAPSAPSLTAAEVDSAIKSGGFAGVVRAIRMKATEPFADVAESSGACAMIVDQFRGGQGGPDHAEVLATLRPHLLAAEVFALAMRLVGEWVAGNPGTIVPDGTHGMDRRRVFDKG